jgi:hypothetical protein
MAFWPIEPDVCLSAWIAIDRADRENGCVEVIPGSHRRTLPHTTSEGTGRFAQMAPPGSFDDRRKVTIELAPGEFFLFDRWLLPRLAVQPLGAAPTRPRCADRTDQREGRFRIECRRVYLNSARS